MHSSPDIPTVCGRVDDKARSLLGLGSLWPLKLSDLGTYFILLFAPSEELTVYKVTTESYEKFDNLLLGL